MQLYIIKKKIRATVHTASHYGQNAMVLIWNILQCTYGYFLIQEGNYFLRSFDY